MVEPKKLRPVHTRYEEDLDDLIEEMVEKWKWTKQDVLNHIARSFFKRHKGVPPPPKLPE
jgi:hypothetical protein